MQEETMKKKKEEEAAALAATGVEIKEEPLDYDDYGNPVKNNPAIKILRQENVARHSGGSNNNSNSNNRRYDPDASIEQEYYNAPPPPPPRPGHHQHHHNVKPYFNQRPSNMGMDYHQYNKASPPPPPPPPPPLPIHVTAPKQLGFPSPQVKALAAVVAEKGDYIEDEQRMKQHDPLMWFLNKPDSTEYKTFRALVAEIKSDIMTHMRYNQAPPPPPPIVTKEFSIKPEPGLIKAEPSFSPLPVQPCFNNFIKIEPSSGSLQQSIPSPYSNFVKSDPCTTPPPPPTTTKAASYDAFNFIKSEQSTVGPTSSSASAATSYSNFVKSEPVSCTGAIKREAPSSDSEETEQERKERKRRSRWGPQSQADLPPAGVVTIPLVPGLSLVPYGSGESAEEIGMNLMNMPLLPVSAMGAGPGASISKITRTNPQLLAYARQAYGRIDLDDDEWKQCIDAYKMNMVFQDIARKKANDEELARAGKFKHEYDSDEETEGGTWEHKVRMKEMEKTRDWAQELTQSAHGKHHIGDFLPPDELAKFMEKYKAVKEGKQLDESEYQEYKLQQDNIGFKMLQKMGWSSGEGLGAENQGILAPIDKGKVPSDKMGLGVEKPGDLNEEDDEYTAYRKRMMLAYRFRPNPLNNPRRAYY
ncbi:SURP and G-patch domain-containing protein 1 isoform X2 [Folsomia candida]|nr:SURP and G-patch domain-containing protein 1 isoform X2 [Folsomia candida]